MNSRACVVGVTVAVLIGCGLWVFTQRSPGRSKSAGC